MITIIVTVLVLVYKSFCNTVCIYDHANKASCCCIEKLQLTIKGRTDSSSPQAIKGFFSTNCLSFRQHGQPISIVLSVKRLWTQDAGARKAIFSSSVSKNRVVYVSETAL